MYDIFRSWRAASEVLLPQNFMPFLMVTLKTATEACLVTIIREFWWFFLVGIAIIRVRGDASHGPAIAWVAVWLLMLIRAARPSLLPKNFRYFWSLATVNIPILFLFMLYFFIPSGVFYLIAPYFIFMAFFFADANCVARDMALAPMRAARFCWMLAPLYVLLVILLACAGRLLCCAHLLLTLCMVLVVMPLMVVVMSRLYVLWIHKEYQRYFECCW